MSKRREKRADAPLPAAVVTGVDRQQRGITAALIGLGVSVLLVLAIIVTGIVSGFGSGLPGYIPAAAAVVVWVGTLVAYVFRKQAAVEAVELEELERSGAADRSIFVDAGDARPALRRVRRVYRYVLPAFAVVAAIVLLAMGIPDLVRQIRVIGLDFGLPSRTAPVAVAMAAMAFVAFIVGRWLIGLSRQPELRLLRAGAGFLIGCAVLLLIGAICLGIADFGEGEDRIMQPVRLAYLAHAAIGVILGVELILNLILDLYRPRKPGEEPRPAVDSRLLALLSTPSGVVASLNDAINYQFGFDVTGGYLYRVIARSFLWLVLAGVVALVLLSSVFIVEPHQQAIVTTFGDASPEPVGPGLHLKAPWPAGDAMIYDVGRLRTLRLGNRPDLQPDAANIPILYANTNESAAALILAPESDVRDTAPASSGATGAEEADAQAAANAPGAALASAEVIVHYRVDDLMAYARNNPYIDDDEPDRLFRQLAEEAMNAQMQRVTMDGLAGPRRLAIAEAIERDLQQAVADAGLGLAVESVGVAGVRPLADAAFAYEEAQRAEVMRDAAIARGGEEADNLLTQAAGSTQAARDILDAIDTYERLVNTGDEEAAQEARQRVESLIAGAEGTAAELLSGARALALEKVLTEEGRLDQFRGEQAAYAAAPKLHRVRRTLEELREVLPEARTYLLAVEPERVRVRYDLDTGRDAGFDLSGVTAN